MTAVDEMGDSASNEGSKGEEGSGYRLVRTSRYRDKETRKLRVGIVAVVFLGLSGLAILTNPDIFYFFYPRAYEFNRSMPLGIGLFLMFLGFSVGAMLYLQTGFTVREEMVETNYMGGSEHRPPKPEKSMHLADGGSPTVVDAQAGRESVPNPNGGFGLGITDYDAMVSLFLAQSRKDPKEVVWADLLARAKKANKISHLDGDLIKGFEQSRHRLLKEVESLGRRGNFNLVLGMMISAVGLFVLATVFIGSGFLNTFAAANEASKAVAESPKEIKDAISFAITYLPRLTFALVIELFAFFFLRLYRASLSEIKYFQNEITNIEAKSLALRASLLTDSSVSLNKAIASLVDTERNHILQKGQSTIELERAKIEVSGMANVAKNAAGLLEVLKPKN
ncbi:hypothetical protein EJ576_10795 [Pseudomonas sp. C 49-2]|uniref:hypothetical protein n=1 Tax=Pseudomonas TaxID=286 RepID=UPI000F832AC1|nr:hypothetical protein [Pseudomonas sp. C 49-2]RTY00784.1 hypothetical protein EJ576_10795 [Pseudomonas sp. C 49-2]